MITKNYIKMCEKAKQLQRLWKPKVGDWVWRKYTVFGEEIDEQFWNKDKMEEIIILTYASCIEGYFHATKDDETRIFNSHNEMHKKTCIYLPTQEQSQEMILNHGHQGYDNSGIATMLSLFSMDYKLEDLTFTELWLAFVMKEKYNKIWTGENWVKAE